MMVGEVSIDFRRAAAALMRSSCRCILRFRFVKESAELEGVRDVIARFADTKTCAGAL